jgi:uncharacterized protein YoaH (UPF0181 family)
MAYRAAAEAVSELLGQGMNQGEALSIIHVTLQQPCFLPMG